VWRDAERGRRAEASAHCSSRHRRRRHGIGKCGVCAVPFASNPPVLLAFKFNSFPARARRTLGPNPARGRRLGRARRGTRRARKRIRPVVMRRVHLSPRVGSWLAVRAYCSAAALDSFFYTLGSCPCVATSNKILCCNSWIIQQKFCSQLDVFHSF
jgi:hypothetical protein